MLHDIQEYHVPLVMRVGNVDGDDVPIIDAYMTYEVQAAVNASFQGQMVEAINRLMAKKTSRFGLEEEDDETDVGSVSNVGSVRNVGSIREVDNGPQKTMSLTDTIQQSVSHCEAPEWKEIRLRAHFPRGPSTVLVKWLIENAHRPLALGCALTSEVLQSITKYRTLAIRTAPAAGNWAEPLTVSKICSRSGQHASRTRDNSFVLYHSKPMERRRRNPAGNAAGNTGGTVPTEGEQELFFGQIEFFFEAHILDNLNAHMVYLRDIKMKADGPLRVLVSGVAGIQSGGEHRVIPRDDILVLAV